MKGKQTSSKTTKQPPRGGADRARDRTNAEPRPETRKRVRKIVERHRETLDKLAE